MTREDAIIIFKRQKKLCLHENDWFHALEMAIKALEQTRWIPVSEKTPLEGQFILCSIAEYADTVHRIIIAKYEENSLYWDEFVTAWMPLPQPYKGESEEA